MNLVKQNLGPWKFKGSMAQTITNGDKLFVVKAIVVQKQFDANNKFGVTLIMPEPKEVEVIDRTRALDILATALPEFKKFDKEKPEDMRRLMVLIDCISQGVDYKQKQTGEKRVGDKDL